jgi:hypothetical protein
LTYLLDANVVSYFFDANRQRELAAASARCPMAMVDEVRQELERDRARGGPAFRAWLTASGIEVRSIEVGSAASATLAQLLPPVPSGKDRGERASIALAAHDPSLTFVTNDGGAKKIALRELWAPGERLLALSVFLRRLFDQSALVEPAILDEIIKKAYYPSAQRPTRWAPWRAGVLSGTSGGALPPPVLGTSA